MSKSRVAITAGAVFLSAALAVILLNVQLSKQSFESAREAAVASESPSVIQPDQVWTYNCELPERRPKTILLTCADGGWLVTDIQWNTWGPKGATGTGTYSENLCEPSCAEGQIVEAPVNLRLTNMTKMNEKYYLRTLDISTSDGKDFPWGRADSFQWDVMEFMELMNG